MNAPVILLYSLQMIEKNTNLRDSQGNGLEAGFELKFPYVEAEVEAIACKKLSVRLEWH